MTATSAPPHPRVSVRVLLSILCAVGGLVLGNGEVLAQTPALRAQVRLTDEQPTSLHDVGYSQDGKFVVASGHDGQLYLWDRATGEPIGTVPAGRSPLLTLALGVGSHDAFAGDRDGNLLRVPLPLPYPSREWGAVVNDASGARPAPGDRWVTSHPQQGIQLWQPTAGPEAGLEVAGKFDGLASPIAVEVFGQSVVGVAADGQVRRWNVADQTLLEHWRLPPVGSVVRVGSDRLAVGGQDGRVRVLQVGAPRPASLVATHSESVAAVAVSEDGRRCVSGATDQHIYLYADGELRWKFDPAGLPAPGAEVKRTLLGLGFVPDSKFIFAHNDQGQLWFLNADDGSLLAYVTGAVGSTDRVAVDSKGRVFAGGRDGRVQRWWIPELRTDPSERPPSLAHDAAVTSVVRTADGLVSGTADGGLRVWKNGQLEKQLSGHAGPVTALAVSPSTERLASADATTIQVRASARDDQPTMQLEAGGSEPVSLAFRGRPEQLVAAYRDGLIRHWNLDAKQISQAWIDLESPTTAFEFSPDRQALLVATEDGALRGVAAGEVEPFVVIENAAASPIEAVRMHRESGRILSVHADGRLRVWSAVDGSVVSSLGAHPQDASDLAIHPAGERLATAGRDGTIKLWKFVEPTVYSEGLHPIADLDVHPNGSMAVTVGADGAAVARSVPSGELVWTTVAADASPLTAVQFRHDGQWLALGDQEGSLLLRSASDGKLLGSAAAYPGPVAALAFSRQHQHVATVDTDGVVKVWKVPLTAEAELAAFGPTVKSLESGLDAVAISTDAAQAIGWTSEEAFTVTVANSAVLKVANPSADPTTAVSYEAPAIWARGTRSGRVELRNAANQLVGEVGAHAGPVTAVALDASSDAFATADASGEIRLWMRPQPAKPITGPAGPVTHLAANQAGDALWAAAGDKSVRHFGWPAGNAIRTVTAPETVTAFDVSPDGKQLAIGDPAGNLLVYDATNGALQNQRRAHDGPLAHVVFVGQKLVSAGEDGDVKVWPAVAPPPLALAGPTAVTRAICRAAEVVALVGDDGQLRIYERKSGKLTKTIPVPGGAVRAVAASRDASRIATGSADGKLRAWNVADGKLLLETAAHQGAVAALQFGAKPSQLISAGDDATLALWTVPSEPPSDAAAPAPLPQKRVETAHQHVNALVVHDQAATVYSAGDDGMIRRWKLADLAAIDVFAQHDSAVASLDLSADGALLCSGGKDQVVKVWKTADRNTLASWKLDNAVHAVAISRDGKAVAAAAEKRIEVFRVQDRRMLESFQRDAPALALLLDSEADVLRVCGAGNKVQWQTVSCEASWPAAENAVAGLARIGADVVSCDGSATLRVWNLKGTLLRELKGQDAGMQHLASDFEGKLLIGADLDRRVFAWDPSNGQRLWEGLARMPVQALAVSRDRTRVIAVGGSQLEVYEATDGTLLEFRALPAEAAAVALPQDSQKVAVGLANNQVWTAELAFQQRFAAHQQAVRSLAYSDTGQQLLSCGDDHRLVLSAVPGGEKVREFAGATGALHAAQFSPDGKSVIASGQEPMVRMWNVADGKLAAELKHPQSVTGLSFNKTSGRLVTIAADGVARVWDVPTQLILQHFPSATGAFLDVQYAADGATIFAAESDGRIRKLAVDAQSVFQPGQGAVRAVLFNAAGDQLITSGAVGSVKVWKVDGEPVRTMAAAAAEIVALDLRVQGDQLAGAGADGQVYVWRLENGALETRIPVGPELVSVDYSHDGGLLVAGDAGRSTVFRTSPVEFVESHLGTHARFVGTRPELLGRVGERSLVHQPLAFERVLQGHEGPVLRVLFTPDGNSLLSSGEDRSVRLWNAANGALTRAFAGHATAVDQCQVIPGTTQFVSGSSDGVIRRWNWPDGQLVHEFQATEPYASLAVSPSGTRLVAVGATLEAWDLATNHFLQSTELAKPARYASFLSETALALADAQGDVSRWTLTCTQAYPGDSQQVHALAMAGHQNEFATSGADKVVKIWSSDGTLVRSLGGAAFAAQHVCFSPDDKLVAAGGDSALKQTQVYVWSAVDGQLKTTLTLPAAVKSIAFMPSDPAVLAAGCVDGVIRLYAMPEGRLLEQIPAGVVMQTLVASPDGVTLRGTAGDSAINALQRQIQMEVPVHGAAITGIEVTADGKYLFTASADQAVTQWRTSDWQKIATFTGLPAAVTTLDLSGDGHKLIGAAAGQAAVWSVPVGETRDAAVAASLILTHPATIRTVSIAPRGNRAVLGGDDQSVALWDLEAQAILQVYEGHTAMVTALDIDPLGVGVYSGAADKTVRRWSQQVQCSHDQLETPLVHLAAGKGPRLLAASANGQFAVWDSDQLHESGSGLNSAAPIAHAAMTPDSRWVLAAGTADANQTLLLWHAPSGKLIARRPTSSPVAQLLALDNEHFLVAGADQSLSLYHLSPETSAGTANDGDEAESEMKMSLRLLGQLRGQSGVALDACLSHDGFTVLANDRTLRSWRFNSSEGIVSVAAHQGPVTALAALADGRIVSGGSDGVVRVSLPPTRQAPAPGQFDGSRRFVYGASVSAVAYHEPTRQVLAAGDRRDLLAWSLDAGLSGRLSSHPRRGERAGQWQCLAVASDSGVIAAGDLSPDWSLWLSPRSTPGNPPTARRTDGHNAAIVDLQFDHTGKRLATVDRTGHVTIWDALLATPLLEVQLPFAARSLCWSSDGGELSVVGRDPRMAQILLKEGSAP